MSYLLAVFWAVLLLALFMSIEDYYRWKRKTEEQDRINEADWNAFCKERERMEQVTKDVQEQHRRDQEQNALYSQEEIMEQLVKLKRPLA